jgi:FkbM family methyltransferase
VKWNLDLQEGIDFSIYLLGAFEPSTAATLHSLIQPGYCVLDIGANIGAHTLGIAQSVGPEGRVFAFEPTDFAYGKLLRNISLNPELKERICTQQVFLGSCCADRVPSVIYSSWPLAGSEPVHPKHRGRLETTRNASMDTLDDFVNRQGIRRVDLIKLDVDGQELPVLQGGQQTLTRFQPVLVMEISPYVHAEQNHSFAALIRLLEKSGYSLVDADRGTPVPLDAALLEKLIPDGAGINVVARIPQQQGP